MTHDYPIPPNRDSMILFRNTMQISQGHLANFRHAIAQAVDFVEKNGPQLIVQTFLDEGQMRAVSYQLYRDSAAILEHWRLADPYIAEVMKHCTVAELEIHGEPNDAVLERMRPMIEDGRAKQTSRIAGFVRPFAPDAGK